MTTDDPSNDRRTAPGSRFPTREVRIGSLRLGAHHPILIQSMTIADTCDTDAVVTEIQGLVEAGCPLVRVTAPSIRDAENLAEIKRRLRADGTDVPMVADIHFTPNAAIEAARHVEKVRVNPGNYADRKKFKVFEVTDAAYAEGLDRVRDKFLPLVRVLKEEGRALRVGTNHGSLSDRILNRFGDTPDGMVESALEFVRICRDEGFHDIVLSMKSSIPSVMIAAYRLLVQKMIAEDMDYPIHLGVTEAGDGIEGRIKSAIGIGSLLVSGIGDTIRVSLTEDAIHELGACENVLAAVRSESVSAVGPMEQPWTGLSLATSPQRRSTHSRRIGRWPIGGEERIAVEARVRMDANGNLSVDDERIVANAGKEHGAEILSLSLSGSDEVTPDQVRALSDRKVHLGIVPVIWELGDGATHPPAETPQEWLQKIDAISVDAGGSRGSLDAGGLGVIPTHVDEWMSFAKRHDILLRWRIPSAFSPEDAAVLHRAKERTAGWMPASGPNWIQRTRDLARMAGDLPLHLSLPGRGARGPTLAGSVLLDGIGDVVCLLPDQGEAWPAGGVSWTEDPVGGAYHILQACRIRLTKTEFIACPSCGRTQFDLQTTTARIRQRTGHLKGVKLAIMGCIVNGPGEMADADFGYVGSGQQRVDLYVGKERVERNIPEAEAEERLVELLKEHGAWREPTPA